MTWFPRRVDRPPLHGVGEHPDYRFSLANERTFLAWVRTALALLAGGIAVVQIVPDFTIPAARHILGIIRLGGPLPPSLLPRLVGAGLAIVMLLALVFVLVEAVQGGR